MDEQNIPSRGVGGKRGTPTGGAVSEEKDGRARGTDRPEGRNKGKYKRLLGRGGYVKPRG